MTAPRLPACRVEPDCELPGRAVIGYARQPRTGVRTSLLVVPAEFANGGIPACVGHAHTALDAVLMGARGPATPPSIESLPAGEADPQSGAPA